MPRHYVTVETNQGNFKWYIPITDADSITLRNITRPNYSEFCSAVLETWNVDITDAQFILGKTNLSPTLESLASYFDFIDFNGVISAGDVWKIGRLQGTWTLSGTSGGNRYGCTFKDPDNHSIFTIYTKYNTTAVAYVRIDCPFVYSTSSNKLINIGYTTENYIAIETSAPNYRGYMYNGSRTFSISDTDSMRLNTYVDVEEDGGGGGGDSDDPYDPSGDGSGYSGTGGGPAPTGGTGTTGNGGLHDDTSDSIPTPSLPSNVATGSGLFTAYNPSASQLASFGSALWSMDITDIDDVLKFLVGGDAFNAIIGLHLLPIQPATGGSSNIKLGKWDSGVSAPKITSQYAQVSFGSVLLPEYWGNSIDYSPYTKVQLALPYIGIVDVDTDDVLGSTNTLTYNIDVLSGAICATLHCAKGNLNSVIYQWSGSCAVSLPVTGANYNGVIGSVLAIAAGAATIAVGGATIAGASGAGAALAAAKGGAAIAGGAGTLAGSALNTFGSIKGKVQKSGAFGANSGALGIMTPYFIVTRPVQSVPTSWQADKGYPANISAQLGSLTGYTEVSEINLECSGTEAEKKEIIDLLKKGVLF